MAKKGISIFRNPAAMIPQRASRSLRGAQGPLHDELVGCPIEAMQSHQPGQDARPGQLGVAGGQVEMHLAGPLPVQHHHGIPAANLIEGQNGQQDPCPQQQDRLNHVRPR